MLCSRSHSALDADWKLPSQSRGMTSWAHAEPEEALAEPEEALAEPEPGIWEFIIGVG
jgi:hypothetical protein